MAALENKFSLAMFDEFLDAFAALPRAQQKKVNKFMRMFRANPTSASINFESISTFNDPNMRTVRIDQTYRAVVLKPQVGNVYVMLWVDHHDKAMDWARNKQCVINPSTGTLQVLTRDAGPAADVARARDDDSRVVEQSDRSAAAREDREPLFNGLSDDHLRSLSVPDELLGLVRSFVVTEDLEAAAPQLPGDTFEALCYVNAGDSIEEVRDAMGFVSAAAIDPEDFGAALEQPSTRRRFALITDDAELAQMLDAPLEKWRVFLHPSQEKIVRSKVKGAIRVLGGAGTGKTVVALHRARHLVRNVYTRDDDRLLFTTFTANLAQDIRKNLASLCTPEELSRIEVIHLDQWVANFLKGRGYPFKIEYWKSGSGALWNMWDEALALAPEGFSQDFFREEWDYVVQPLGCTSWEDYRRAKRPGRGVALTRQKRKEIWPVFARYRSLLDAAQIRESAGAMRDAAGLIEAEELPSAYRCVLVDEAQDMSTVAFAMLRQVAPRTEGRSRLFIVGDGHQRIYRRKVVLRDVDINIVGRGHSHKLYINYRTTDEIRQYAVALLKNCSVDDLDGGVDSNDKYRSLFHGGAPKIERCDSFEEEVAAIKRFVGEGTLENTCLVARTNRLVSEYEEALHAAGIDCFRLQRRRAEDDRAPGLRIATMHRVKGLEFDRLVIAGVNEGVVPLQAGEMRSEDSAVRAEAEQRERALFYVAVTRARREVLITCSGKPGPWIAVGGDGASDAAG